MYVFMHACMYMQSQLILQRELMHKHIHTCSQKHTDTRIYTYPYIHTYIFDSDKVEKELQLVLQKEAESKHIEEHAIHMHTDAAAVYESARMEVCMYVCV